MYEESDVYGGEDYDKYAVEVMVEQEPARVKRTSETCAGKNVDNCRRYCYPQEVAANKVRLERVPVVVAP